MEVGLLATSRYPTDMGLHSDPMEDGIDRGLCIPGRTTSELLPNTESAGEAGLHTLLPLSGLSATSSDPLSHSCRRYSFLGSLDLGPAIVTACWLFYYAVACFAS